MKLERLHGRKNADYLRREGNVWRGKTMTIRWLPKHPRHPSIDRDSIGLYVGTFGSAKLHKSAVKRNRMRRRCREALRVRLKDQQIPQTMQLMITPRIASLDCSYDLIRNDIENFCMQILFRL